MSKFNEKNETIIGNIGENIIKEHIENLGYVVYNTETDCSHPVDFIVFNGDKYDDILSFHEVKVKPRRFIKFDTGVDITVWHRYIRIMKKYNVDLFIYFIDEIEECIYKIYTNDIYKNKKYRIDNNDRIVYFNLIDTQFIRLLYYDEIEMFKNKRIELNHYIPAIHMYGENKFFSNKIYIS